MNIVKKLYLRDAPSSESQSSLSQPPSNVPTVSSSFVHDASSSIYSSIVSTPRGSSPSMCSSTHPNAAGVGAPTPAPKPIYSPISPAADVTTLPFHQRRPIGNPPSPPPSVPPWEMLSVDTSLQMRLPFIELPPFDGNYEPIVVTTSAPPTFQYNTDAWETITTDPEANKEVLAALDSFSPSSIQELTADPSEMLPAQQSTSLTSTNHVVTPDQPPACLQSQPASVTQVQSMDLPSSTLPAPAASQFSPVASPQPSASDTPPAMSLRPRSTEQQRRSSVSRVVRAKNDSPSAPAGDSKKKQQQQQQPQDHRSLSSDPKPPPPPPPTSPAQLQRRDVDARDAAPSNHHHHDAVDDDAPAAAATAIDKTCEDHFRCKYWPENRRSGDKCSFSTKSFDSFTDHLLAKHGNCKRSLPTINLFSTYPRRCEMCRDKNVIFQSPMERFRHAAIHHNRVYARLCVLCKKPMSNFRIDKPINHKRTFHGTLTKWRIVAHDAWVHLWRVFSMAPTTFDLKSYLTNPLFIREHKLLVLNVFQSYTNGERMSNYRESIEFNSEDLPQCLIRYSESFNLHLRDQSVRNPLSEFVPPSPRSADALVADRGAGGGAATTVDASVRRPQTDGRLTTAERVDLSSSSSGSEDETGEVEEEEEEEKEEEEEEEEEERGEERGGGGKGAEGRMKEGKAGKMEVTDVGVESREQKERRMKRKRKVQGSLSENPLPRKLLKKMSSETHQQSEATVGTSTTPTTSHQPQCRRSSGMGLGLGWRLSSATGM